MGKQSDIGLIGLAVMGQNLVLNMEEKGYTVSVFNRTTTKVDQFVQGSAKGKNITGTRSIKEFVESLATPRKMMIMVKAGQPVDDVIEELIPHLDKGDIIIDGGNSHFPDTNRRCEYLEGKGFWFIGMGVSGGEEGARHGPSMMPGGSKQAWPHVKEIFQAISAKADGEPCCDWVGSGGSGHYVKMVHNGIEYGDIQLICETYDFLKNVLGLDNQTMSTTFDKWDESELKSFLIELTSKVLAFKDVDGKEMVDKVIDVAMQKGTGLWTSESALDLKIPVTLITEAVYARMLSTQKEEREHLHAIYKRPHTLFAGDREEMIEHARCALYASKITSYVQGFILMRAASEKYGWDLNYGSISMMWREGCIIKSAFLYEIKKAFDKKPDLENLMYDDFFKEALLKNLPSWRKIASACAEYGVPMPCGGAALSFFDAITSNRLPANLTMAIRDAFGAHTVETYDNPGHFNHIDWLQTGGTAQAGTYNAG
jgi:6-phosphogluconate dehydrogenase